MHFIDFPKVLIFLKKYLNSKVFIKLLSIAGLIGVPVGYITPSLTNKIMDVFVLINRALFFGSRTPVDLEICDRLDYFYKIFKIY